MVSSCSSDSSFGPVVTNCRGDFDFTITFEEAILSLLPTSCFILLVIPQLWLLRYQSSAARSYSYTIYYVQLALLGFLIVLDLALLALVARHRDSLAEHGKIIAAAALNLIAALLLPPLYIAERAKSGRPSALLSIYLSLTMLFDAARARTWWLAFGGTSYTGLLTAVVVIKFITTASLEVVPGIGRSQRHGEHAERCLEETCGLFSQMLLFWLNPLMVMGSRKILQPSDLYPLDKLLSVSHPLRGIQTIYHPLKEGSGSLHILLRLVRSAGLPLLRPVPARLLLMGFSFCQPFFIQRLIVYLEDGRPSPKSVGIGLIGASIVIYSGMALSTSSYWYSQYRVLTRLRATIGHAVFAKSLQLPTVDDGVLTVMNMDISRIYEGLHNVHEIWANPVEVAIAAWLLQRQIGTAFVAPIVIVVICFGLTLGVGKFAAKYQGDWSQKTQDRVKLTSGVISNIKGLELSGRSTQIRYIMQRLREDELDSGVRFRLLNTVSTCIAFAPMLLAPVITFAVTSAGHRIETSQIYASLSYLTLLSNPLSQLFQTIPSMLASTASYKRIHDFLARPNRAEYRHTNPASEEENPKHCISLRGVSMGWQKDKWSLVDADLDFPNSQLTIVTGPVASGKSTLCQGILGEVPFVRGHVSVQPACLGPVGFCGQVPFLTDSSVRGNIIGPEQRFDTLRYESVLRATLLDADLRQLPKHDETRVGSNGINLSGGQKQRVALARALYLDADLYVFDDALSGLDVKTADEVVHRLFGPEGILKSKTVIWCTHLTKYLPYAEQVILLGSDGRVQSCGPPDSEVMNLAEQTTQDAKETNEISITDESPEVGKIEEDKGLDKSLLRNKHDGRVYSKYLNSLNLSVKVLILAAGVVFSFSYNFGTVWIGFWPRNFFHRREQESRSFYLGLYGLFQVLAVITLAGFVGGTQMRMSREAGSQFHARALKTLLSLPLSYFSSVDTGTTINLFSQDIGLLDNQLTFAISNTLLSGFAALGQLVVVAVATPYITIGYPFIFGILYLLQSYYLKTSRQLRLLDLEARSPLYAKLQDVVTGMATIRSFQWMNRYQQDFDASLNQSLQPDYLLDLVQQWLTLSLNLIICVIAVAITSLTTQLGGVSQAGLVGASLVSLLTLGELACATVRSWVQLETSLGAVKRLLDFDDMGDPDVDVGVDPPPDWPGAGRIDLEGVSAAYGGNMPEASMALRDVHLSIAGGEKVAIIGRTGSGKSSLLLLLMRMLDPTPDTADKITVDGIPLSHINRKTLRKRIIQIPQEMIFLSGTDTLRHLLDPYDDLADEDCSNAVAETGLHSVLNTVGGLDSPVSPDSMSHGQKKLLNLAVAVARKYHNDHTARSQVLKTEKKGPGGILLMDEVTSGVDAETEAKTNEVIFRVFRDYTVIYITHRLAFLEQFDSVYSMSGGVLERVKDIDGLGVRSS